MRVEFEGSNYKSTSRSSIDDGVGAGNLVVTTSRVGRVLAELFSISNTAVYEPQTQLHSKYRQHSRLICRRAKF
jgi:hypothetical protein